MTLRVAFDMTQKTPSLVRFCRSENSGSWSNVLPHSMRQNPRNSTGLLGSPDEPGPKIWEAAVGESRTHAFSPTASGYLPRLEANATARRIHCGVRQRQWRHSQPGGRGKGHNLVTYADDRAYEIVDPHVPATSKA